jgi:hypothetical protein
MPCEVILGLAIRLALSQVLGKGQYVYIETMLLYLEECQSYRQINHTP